MTTWNVTDAAGEQHRVSADSYWTDPHEGIVHFMRADDGIRNEIAFFTKPVAVTEDAPRLTDPETGEDRGEIAEVTWSLGESTEEHKFYTVKVKR